jgi:serine/threonine protein kinase
MTSAGQSDNLRCLGDFQIIRELGRGGMGVVYEALQISLNRKVALKVLSGTLGLTPKAVERFHREAEAAARLHHTNIVPVHATGEQDGTHFYAMELIDGPSLDHVIKQLRQAKKEAGSPETTSRQGSEPPNAPHLEATGPYVGESGPAHALTSSSLSSGSQYFDTVARMIAEVADALDHAHKSGVIHRDIKPSNLLLSSADRLSINDFGLARMLEQPGMTMTGEFVGTPAYMSPEQVAAGRAPLNHRTDIYSLGTTFFELLTLQRPFTGERRDEVIAQIMHKEPKTPRRINRSVPLDLETICMKAMEKDPDRRYQSADELAEDLRRYVNRFAILARRAGLGTRAKKWLRRNPALSAAGMVVFLAIVVASLFAWRAHELELRQLADERLREADAIAEKRRATIERGMVAALAADLPGAERAVADAELLGASAGETRMLQGFIALHNGQSALAVSHLEQAVRLLPDRIAPRALLALAYYEQGNSERLRLIAEFQAIVPETPEDKLFKGNAIAIDEPEEGLHLIDEALAAHPSTLGHLLRADARLYLAQYSGEVAAAENAVQSAELAKQLLPENPERLAKSCGARIAAVAAYESAGDSGTAAAHLAAAVREAEKLLRFDRNPSAALYRYDVAAIVDGLEGRLDRTAELRAARAIHPQEFLLLFYEAENLFCLGKDKEAAALAEEDSGATFRYLRAVAALSQPDGRAIALRAIVDGFAGSGSTWQSRFKAAPVLYALDRQRFETLLKELNREADLVPGTRRLKESQRLLAMLGGTLSEGELLSSQAPSRIQLCTRHYYIAWKHLGDGDCEGARKAFEQAYRCKLVDESDWVFARCILIRMKNPSWPQALRK